MRIGFDATSLTGREGIARFQREFLRAAAAHGLVEELDVFVPEQPDEEALPEVDGWRYRRVPTRPMVGPGAAPTPPARAPPRARRGDHGERAGGALGAAQVVYVYEHPGHRAQRSRAVGTSPRQRLVDSTTLLLFRVAMRRAAVVIAASESTARDLAPMRAVPVVHSGAPSRGLLPRTRAAPHTPPPSRRPRTTRATTRRS